MAITNGYISLDDFKIRARIIDGKDDLALESMINQMSRFIDAQCWRRFYSVNETRYFTADDTKILDVFDITSVDALKTDSAADRTYGTTWSATDYDLLPYNASLDGEPYTQIKVSPNGDYAFPLNLDQGVEIKGDFGYITATGETPAGIVEACVLGINRALARVKTPLGVSASAALGEMNVVIRELKTDPDFQAAISHFKRLA